MCCQSILAGGFKNIKGLAYSGDASAGAFSPPPVFRHELGRLRRGPAALLSPPRPPGPLQHRRGDASLPHVWKNK